MHKQQAKQTDQSSQGNRIASSVRRVYVARIVFFLVVCGGLCAAVWTGKVDGRETGASQSSPAAQTSGKGQNTVESGTFSPAHKSLGQTISDFFNVYRTPVQPIAFNHKIHLAKGLQCTSCHSAVTQGPDAGIPSVTYCMACHRVIATDNSEIKKLAAYAAKGQDVPWQRVNWFYPSAHVRFQHAPHIRAGVNCTACHGDVSQQTVAVRGRDLTMNACLSCHKEKGVSVDCTVCHY